MKKIVTVVGARPQFIKAAMVSHAMRLLPDLQEKIVHTGQHYDTNMSQIFLDELTLPPIAYHLGIGSASHGKQTGDMLIALEEILLEEKPDTLLIYGDTNSTLAGALAASKLHIPIAHVEAGLRSFNRRMPEEINRLVADQLASMLFAPTQTAITNLVNEGYAKERIIATGDVMYDAALLFADIAAKNSTVLQRLFQTQQNYVLATIHRAENTDTPSRLMTIFAALEQVSTTLPVVLPLHPRTRKMLEQQYPKQLHKTSIIFIEPVGYLDMIMLEKNAALIVTDSGGVQKEAFFYKVPCLTLRDETEWLETVELGWNTLVPVRDKNSIHDAIMRSLGAHGLADQFPYGKGNAAALIVKHLLMGERVCEFG